MLSSSSRWGWLLKPVRNLLYLPSTLYRGPLAKTREALLTHEPQTLLLHGFELAANAAWWGATLYAAWLAWQAIMRQRSSSSPEPWICALVFALGNLCLVLLLQSPDARFTYFWFALGPIFAALAHKRYSIGLATALGLSLVVPRIFALHRAQSADAIRNYLLSKRSGAALTRLLGQLPPSVSAVYLVDDMIAQGTAPEYLARFAGFHGKLIVVNSVTPILGCQAPQSASSRYRLNSSPDSMTLDYTAAACFYQVNQAPLRLFDGHGAIERGPWMKYDYPRLAVSAPVALRATTNDYDPGSPLERHRERSRVRSGRRLCVAGSGSGTPDLLRTALSRVRASDSSAESGLMSIRSMSGSRLARSARIDQTHPGRIGRAPGRS